MNVQDVFFHYEMASGIDYIHAYCHKIAWTLSFLVIIERLCKLIAAELSSL